ncbi:hypothetical protein PYK79_49920 [Streptomyces sp. ID05-04B]|uniref:hypothetical protein n=1 Tax=Streptomyces sp. ID05-04B TaxID=3028661 RepID=UPI0029C5298F|nr:hypothetical protein [Streptomyces sp. ID05-04B]MDX5569798.1 hypothetical protein [Streptomyces sp. ID05-04B]
MNMTDLEDVAHRYKEATAALDAVRIEMQTTAIALLQQPDIKQADVARVTGWSREHLRRIREKAEMEALRRKVAELTEPAPAEAKRPSPAAAPRQQVTQSLPKPAPLDLAGISPEVAALSLARVRQLAASAEARTPEWVAEIREEHPDADGPRLCYLIVDVGFRMGRKPPELADQPTTETTAPERPQSSEETTG